MRIRGTSRLRTRYHSRLSTSETNSLLNFRVVSPSISQLPSTPILSNAMPTGLGFVMVPTTHPTFQAQPRPRALTAVSPLYSRNRSFYLPLSLSHFVGHSGLCCPLAHVCIFLGSSPFVGRFVLCCFYEGRLGNFRTHNVVCSVHKILTITTHMHMHMHMHNNSGEGCTGN